MRLRVKKTDVLWLTPIFGILLGLAYAFVYMHGLTVTWQYIGKPPAGNISKIIGFGSDYRLYVKTDAGFVYSVEYRSGRDHPLGDPIEWRKEATEQVTLPAGAIEHPSEKLISWPLQKKVSQTYEMGFLGIESIDYVKLALAEDGNLWMWNYGLGALSGLSYFLFPIYGIPIGSILGFVIFMIILLIEWVKQKWGSRSGRPGAVEE